MKKSEREELYETIAGCPFAFTLAWDCPFERLFLKNIRNNFFC